MTPRVLARAAIVSGGVLCAVDVAATAAFLRSLWSYDERTDEYAVRERLRRESLDVQGD